MFTRDQFRQVKRLKHFLENKALHYQWLFIPKDIDLTLDTLCLGVRDDFEGFEEFSEELEKEGMCEFLSTDQLEDIVDNLRLQKSSFTDSELLLAVEFYFKRDAFIDLLEIH